MASLAHLLSATAGAISHIVYFNRGGHHLYGTAYLLTYTIIYATWTIALHLFGASLDSAAAQVSRWMCSYFAGLYLSLLIYRSFLHPLNKFPGPFGARISKFFLSTRIKDRTAFRTIHQLHEGYGDFVRMGPSDLSVAHPSATNAIYGPASSVVRRLGMILRCHPVRVFPSSIFSLPHTRTFQEIVKYIFPRLLDPQSAIFTDADKSSTQFKKSTADHIAPVSLQTTRSRTDHDQRRRLWSAAFSDKALRGYETRMLKYRRKLLSQIDAFGSQPVDVSKWFNLYTYDTMGDLAFGRPFGMLDASEQHWAIKLIIEGLEPHSWLLPVWFLRVAQAIPGVMDNWFKALAYC
ncbi:MAG: hypothetical protein Q9221_005583 [Calogaya cf. arnoldii]